jgi:hypothetical protein
VTARELFELLAPLVAPAVEEVFHRRDLCVLTTRIAIDVASYFDIHVEPLPVKVILYNAAFARHVEAGFAGVERGNPAAWGDGSWSVGIGFCAPPDGTPKWDGHLIAVADGCFADFSIQQAERVEHDIITGPAIVGPYGRVGWNCTHEESGTVVEYKRTGDDSWRTAPDWRDAKRRRPIVGKLIRAVRREAA